MDVWVWSSPVGWAVFLVACDATLAHAGWSFQVFIKAVERFVALPVNKK
jgi:hypothetical protein